MTRCRRSARQSRRSRSRPSMFWIVSIGRAGD